MSSLFLFDLDINKEYVPAINDMIRMGVIQIVAQLLFYFTNSSQNPFFSLIFLQTLSYILIGILVYWLVIRRIVIFK